MTDPDLRPAQAVLAELRAAMLAVVDTFKAEMQIAPALDALLASDAPVTHTVAEFDVAAARTRVITVLDHYETMRRDARIAIWKEMLAEGCSLGEIGRVFGVSRQLVHHQITASEDRATWSTASFATQGLPDRYRPTGKC